MYSSLSGCGVLICFCSQVFSVIITRLETSVESVLSELSLNFTPSYTFLLPLTFPWCCTISPGVRLNWDGCVLHHVLQLAPSAMHCGYDETGRCASCRCLWGGPDSGGIQGRVSGHLSVAHGNSETSAQTSSRPSITFCSFATFSH